VVDEEKSEIQFLRKVYVGTACRYIREPIRVLNWFLAFENPIFSTSDYPH
jgi:hypothetical protein